MRRSSTAIPVSLPLVTLVVALAVVPLLLPLAGCGGGGGGGGSGAVAGDTGTVAFLVKDAPIADLEALIVTIERVELLGNGDPFLLFEGSRTVDLLEFDDMEFILALADDVPVGTYDKIRLRVTDPQVEPNPDGYPVIVTGNGKIDLLPHEPFDVTPGANLAIRIDFDANNSVHVVLTGNNRFIVRPVIFVVVEDGLAAPVAVRDIAGVVLERDLVAGELLVDVDDAVGDVTIDVDAATTIFDSELELADLGAIEVGDRVLIRGRLQASLHVLGEVILRGDPLRLRGELTEGSDPQPFPFALDPDQEIAGTLDATLVDGVRVYQEDGPEIPADPLADGTRARFTGRYFVADDLYRVGLVDVEVQTLDGIIESLDLGGTPPTFVVRDSVDVLHSVALDDASTVRFVGDGPVPLDLLAPGLEVAVVIEGEIAGIPRAEDVAVTPLAYPGEVLNVDAANRELLIAPESGDPPLLLGIADGASILLVTDTMAMPIELGEVLPGDDVNALGLPDGTGTPVIFTLIVFAP